MKIFRTLVMVLACIASFPASARFNVQVINYTDVPATGAEGRTLTLAQVKRAIQNAAAERKWELSDQGPGRMLATLHFKGKHTVMTEIAYSTEKLSLTYKDSLNMRYSPGADGAGEIHPHYNRWVYNLKEAIRASLVKD